MDLLRKAAIRHSISNALESIAADPEYGLAVEDLHSTIITTILKADRPDDAAENFIAQIEKEKAKFFPPLLEMQLQETYGWLYRSPADVKEALYGFADKFNVQKRTVEKAFAPLFGIFEDSDRIVSAMRGTAEPDFLAAVRSVLPDEDAYRARNNHDHARYVSTMRSIATTLDDEGFPVGDVINDIAEFLGTIKPQYDRLTDIASAQLRQKLYHSVL